MRPAVIRARGECLDTKYQCLCCFLWSSGAPDGTNLIPMGHGWAELASQEWRGEKEGLAGGLGKSWKGGWQITQLLVSRKLGGHGCRRFMCGDKALGRVKGQSREQGKQLLPALRVPGSADKACEDTVFRKTYFVPLGDPVPPDRCYWCANCF